VELLQLWRQVQDCHVQGLLSRGVFVRAVVCKEIMLRQCCSRAMREVHVQLVWPVLLVRQVAAAIGVVVFFVLMWSDCWVLLRP
jgi:hypothetical protein